MAGENNLSWSAYMANQQVEVTITGLTGLLPLFRESAHTLAMVKHGINVIKQATEHVNPEQVPVLTVDQPLYAIAKKIQWMWPRVYGEGKFYLFIYVFKILKTIQSRTPYKRGAEVKRIHVYKILFTKSTKE